MLINGEFARRLRELGVHILISPNENQSLYSAGVMFRVRL